MCMYSVIILLKQAFILKLHFFFQQWNFIKVNMIVVYFYLISSFLFSFIFNSLDPNLVIISLYWHYWTSRGFPCKNIKTAATLKSYLLKISWEISYIMPWFIIVYDFSWNNILIYCLPNSTISIILLFQKRKFAHILHNFPTKFEFPIREISLSNSNNYWI